MGLENQCEKGSCEKTAHTPDARIPPGRPRVGLYESELIYWDSRCSKLFVDQPHLFPAVPDSAQDLQLKVFTEAR